MSAFGWIALGHRKFLASWLRRRKTRTPVRRGPAPAFDALEKIDLLSRSVLPHFPASMVEHLRAPRPAAGVTLTPDSIQIQGIMAAASQTTSTQTNTQTATVPSRLTNFTSQPFTPPINLFNPILGQLVAVQVSASATNTSTITSQNLSTTSTAVITGTTSGQFLASGLNASSIPLSITPATTSAQLTAQPYAGEAPFSGPSTVTFPNLTATSPASANTYTYTDPIDLAYFTAGNGRTTITPTLSANVVSTASAPGGNLQTMASTSASGVVTVTYDYVPAVQSVVRLVRFGIHHQPTTLQLSFSAPLNPTEATNPAYYKVIIPNRFGSFTGPGSSIVGVTSALYDPTFNTVTLTTAKRLNYHHLFQLQVSLPSNNGNTITIEFGGRNSLGGFLNPHDHNVFVPVAHGRILR